MRGQINYRERSQQIIDFSGLRYKNITPTDIDGAAIFFRIRGFFEIQGEVFIFIDPKLEGKQLERGQELAYRRIIDNLIKPAICIIADHNVEDKQKDIIACDCKVRQYRVKGEWFTPQKEMTVKELIDKFLTHHGFDNYVNGSNSLFGE